MKLEVEVISKETINPSSPTPCNLRHYQLSFLDQVAPIVYNPLVLFYSSTTTTTAATAISTHLKKSLSETLTLFYPLAGRMTNDKSSIHCNDDGVPYTEARVNCKLADVTRNPVPGELSRLLPFLLDDVTDVVFGVQLNVFDCGGFAIGACLSHQIADALSLFTFLNRWALIARGEEKSPKQKPEFVSVKLFPPKNVSGFDARSGITKENIVSKFFVFDDEVVENLRVRYGDERPTRVEALSAFIWSRYVAVTGGGEGSDPPHGKKHVVIHAVNLRPKMEPPLPPDSFGNYFRFTMTVPTLNPQEECYGLAKQVRDEIKKVDKEYVRKLQDDEGNEHLSFLMDTADRVLMKEELVAFNFTSLCRFPLYDADFGWGKPAWVGSPALTFKNLVVFVDAKIGGGIEAYVSMEVEDMAKFEVDNELMNACDNNKTRT